MKLGDTLITTRPGYDRDNHLWIVVTDPLKDDDRRVLILNITTAERFHDHSCVLHCGDHPFITHDSCVNYGGGYVNSVAFLEHKAQRRLIEFREPASLTVLQRIWDGAVISDFISFDHLEMLQEQGLVSV